MGVNPRRTDYANASDRRALINDTGVNDGVGCTLVPAAWSAAAGVTNGIVPALYPVVVSAAGIATPWTAGALSGLLLDSVDLSKGPASVGYMYRGVVDPTLLPVNAAAGTGAAFKFVANGA